MATLQFMVSMTFRVYCSDGYLVLWCSSHLVHDTGRVSNVEGTLLLIGKVYKEMNAVIILIQQDK